MRLRRKPFRRPRRPRARPASPLSSFADLLAQNLLLRELLARPCGKCGALAALESENAALRAQCAALALDNWQVRRALELEQCTPSRPAPGPPCGN